MTIRCRAEVVFKFEESLLLHHFIEKEFLSFGEAWRPSGVRSQLNMLILTDMVEEQVNILS